MKEGAAYLLAFIDLHFEKLMHSFFVVESVHDREVNHSA
jgi:hypothetical protein